MDAQLIDQLLLFNGSKLPAENLSYLRNKLEDMDEQTAQMRLANLKSPTLALILSIFVGELGVDRIYAGDILLGIIKLLTCGGLGIWWIYDLIVIMSIVRKKNYEMLVMGVDF